MTKSKVECVLGSSDAVHEAGDSEAHTSSPDDRQKCRGTSRPLEISDWASQKIDVAELLIIDETASDTFAKSEQEYEII